jgi:protease IV
MISFLKYTLASIVGVLIGALILFFIFFTVIGGIVSSTSKEVSVKSNSILQLQFDKAIPDRSSENPLENFDFANFKPNPTIGLTDIVKAIHQAQTDDNIRGIYLDLSVIPAGMGTIEEIRNALIDFKKSKKFIISFADGYTHGSYYLASVADSIFLNPQGRLTFIGLRSEQLFFKGALEKLDLEPQIIRHGKFKSAIEPLINDRMSDANKEQLSALLTALWDHILDGISVQRKIDKAELNRLADGLIIRNAQQAFEHKLIDGVRFKDEVMTSLARLSGVESDKKIEFVTINKYHKVPKTKGTFSKNKIALVYASGEINMGPGNDQTIGSEGLSKAIREAREDTSIKAIVLRINSPGGSALASDIIWRELSLSAKVKPLIVSMGSVAASGGYYIAAPGDTILADPTTITGSIGVFGVMLNAKNFFNKKLGITSDVVKTNSHSDMESIYRPLLPEEKEAIQSEVENTYDVFLSRVAEGRKLSKAAVDSIGQGRVWSAMDAKRLGLVDLIGGLDKALEIAAFKAHLKDYRVVDLPKQEDPLTSLFNDFSTKMKISIIRSELGQEQTIYEGLKSALSNQGILTRMPFEIHIY